MKKIVLTLCLILSLTAAMAAVPGNSRLDNVVSKCRRYDGVEVVHLNRFMVWAIKGVARVAGVGDEDIREALALAKGVNSVTVMDYDDCCPELKNRITRRIDRSLRGHEILMEAGDNQSRIQIYGVVDERRGTVGDLVLFIPSDCALIYITGSISTDTLFGLIAEND